MNKLFKLKILKYFLIIIFFILNGCSKDNKNSGGAQTSEIIKDTIVQKTDSVSIANEIKDSSDNINKSGLGYVQYGINKLPSDIKYQGSVVAMAKWDDKSGENILFITETNENSNEDTRGKELYGYQYIIVNSGNKQLWRINDFVKDCPVDLTLDYIDKSLTITDLDKNGIAESAFLYKMSCKGDVSADEMKLIMHEGENKYAIRGSMNLIMNGQELEKGSMEADVSFDKAPKEFLDFAKDQWNEYKTEKIGNTD